MAWIRTIAVNEAEGRLKSLYERVLRPDGGVDNILKLHSLRPHSLEGHMAIYKYVLHHSGNVIPKWFLEALGVWTSLLNGCAYCVDHHYEGMKRLIGDHARSSAIRRAFEDRALDEAFTGRELTALHYARKLTETPAAMTEGDVSSLRAAGWDDGEILEINQVVSYFAYANRTVLGLGGSTQGDILGLSPSDNDDPENWSHR